jgi:hypothetical protein
VCAYVCICKRVHCASTRNSGVGRGRVGCLEVWLTGKSKERERAAKASKREIERDRERVRRQRKGPMYDGQLLGQRHRANEREIDSVQKKQRTEPKGREGRGSRGGC